MVKELIYETQIVSPGPVLSRDLHVQAYSEGDSRNLYGRVRGGHPGGLQSGGADNIWGMQVDYVQLEWRTSRYTYLCSWLGPDGVL